MTDEQDTTTPGGSPADELQHVLTQGLLTFRVMRELAKGNDHEAGRSLGVLITIGGAQGLYAACATWAEFIGDAMIERDSEPGFAGLEIVCAETGELVEPTELPDDMQGSLWAGRFVTANANRDQDTMQALFLAECQTGRLDGVTALAGMAAAVATEGGAW